MNEILLQYTDGASNKFWKVTWDDSSITVTYGKVGTDGTTKTTECSNPEVEANKQANAKMKKGYEKVEGEFKEQAEMYVRGTVDDEEGMMSVFVGYFEDEDEAMAYCEYTYDEEDEDEAFDPESLFNDDDINSTPLELDFGFNEFIDHDFLEMEFLEEATNDYEEIFSNASYPDYLIENIEEITKSLNGKKINAVFYVGEIECRNMRKISKSKKVQFVACYEYER